MSHRFLRQLGVANFDPECSFLCQPSFNAIIIKVCFINMSACLPAIIEKHVSIYFSSKLQHYGWRQRHESKPATNMCLQMLMFESTPNPGLITRVFIKRTLGEGVIEAEVVVSELVSAHISVLTFSQTRNVLFRCRHEKLRPPSSRRQLTDILRASLAAWGYMGSEMGGESLIPSHYQHPPRSRRNISLSGLLAVYRFFLPDETRRGASSLS